MVMPARPPETVSAYLAQLRRALKGAPAALISDALADCEDHLNNEIAQNPQLTEPQILATVIETYGTPEEIAEDDGDMETTSSTPCRSRAPTARCSTCCCRWRPASSTSPGQ